MTLRRRGGASLDPISRGGPQNPGGDPAIILRISFWKELNNVGHGAWNYVDILFVPSNIFKMRLPLGCYVC